MDDAVATAKHSRQLRPVENGSLDEHRSLFQSPWRPDIENQRRVTPVEQPRDEGLAEIPRSSRQKHLHRLLRHLPLFARQYPCTQERSICIEMGEPCAHILTERGGTEWPAAIRPAKSPISSRFRRAFRATPSSSSTFEVGRHFRCTMRVDCSELDPGAVIRPAPGEWHPRIPERLDDEELADWRAGRDAVYQLAALTIGARLAVADA